MGSWLWKHSRSRQVDGPVVYDRDPNAIVSAGEPATGDLMILKQKPSAFFGTALQSYLTLLGCDSLIFTGGATSGCVRASVVDALLPTTRLQLWPMDALTAIKPAMLSVWWT